MDVHAEEDEGLVHFCKSLRGNGGADPEVSHVRGDVGRYCDLGGGNDIDIGKGRGSEVGSEFEELVQGGGNDGTSNLFDDRSFFLLDDRILSSDSGDDGSSGRLRNDHLLDNGCSGRRDGDDRSGGHVKREDNLLDSGGGDRGNDVLQVFEDNRNHEQFRDVDQGSSHDVTGDHGKESRQGEGELKDEGEDEGETDEEKTGDRSGRGNDRGGNGRGHTDRDEDDSDRGESGVSAFDPGLRHDKVDRQGSGGRLFGRSALRVPFNNFGRRLRGKGLP